MIPEIEAIREEARKNWPEAEFLPFDPPPVGEKLALTSDVDGSVRRIVTVLRSSREYELGVKHIVCPTCKCDEKLVISTLAGWWIVRWDGETDTRTGKEMETVEFPPKLKRPIP
jgi:hypothetical protein